MIKAQINPVTLTMSAYEFVWRERRAFAAAAVAPIVLLSIVAALMHLIVGIDRPHPTGSDVNAADPSASNAPRLLLFIAKAVFYCMFSVLWYRYSFGQSGGSTLSVALFRDKRAFSFLNKFIGMVLITAFVMIPVIFIIMMVLVTTSPGLIEDIAIGQDPLTAMQSTDHIFKLVLFGVGILIVAHWMIGRITLALPAITLDEPVGFRRSWRWTRGYGGVMLFTVLLPGVPIMLAQMLLSFLLGPIQYAIGVFDTVTGSFILALFENGITFFGYAVSATALSIAYQRLKAAQPDPFEDSQEN